KSRPKKSSAEKRMSSLKATFAVVTGSSQGLGKEIALQFAKVCDGETSVLVLHGRNEERLAAVHADIKAVNPLLTVCAVVADLVEHESYKRLVEIFDEFGKQSFERAFLVHNAGDHMGFVKNKAHEIDDHQAIQRFMSMHLTSMVVLTSNFMKKITSHALIKTKQYVVNVSSMSALVPMKTLALYCSAKAAREMFMQVLALEDPEVRALNFDPAIMPTEMLINHIRDAYDRDFARKLTKMGKDGEIFSAVKIAEEFIKVVILDEWKSGEHVAPCKFKV
ncbi:unnamed protein product, partial [Owenia fusiformis]